MQNWFVRMCCAKASVSSEHFPVRFDFDPGVRGCWVAGKVDCNMES